MSGRVYSLTHTAAANTHTHTQTMSASRRHRRNPEKQTHTPKFVVFSKRQNPDNLSRTKANKHSCFPANPDRPAHMQSQGLLSRRNSPAERMCVCSFSDRVSLYATKPGFLRLKLSVICLYKGPGYSVQATWTKIEAPV